MPPWTRPISAASPPCCATSSTAPSSLSSRTQNGRWVSRTCCTAGRCRNRASANASRSASRTGPTKKVRRPGPLTALLDPSSPGELLSCRMAGKEATMIELTEEMRQAVREHPGTPLRLVDPSTQEAFVLLRAKDFDRLTEYDTSPWTDEEMELLHEEAARMADNFRAQP